MIVGSAPEVGVCDDAGARGQAVLLAASSRCRSAPAAAPSTMPEELPAVVDVVDLLHVGVLLHGDVVEASHVTHAGEGGLQLAERLSAVVPGRMCSSLVEQETPLMSLTGTIDLAK
jgi:hypothetical protein